MSVKLFVHVLCICKAVSGLPDVKEGSFARLPENIEDLSLFKIPDSFMLI